MQFIIQLLQTLPPYVSHQEQNVLILRYVSQNEKTELFEIYERFIEFINFNKKTGEGISFKKKNIIPKCFICT